jgi:hypothetical protein
MFTLIKFQLLCIAHVVSSFFSFYSLCFVHNSTTTISYIFTLLWIKYISWVHRIEGSKEQLNRYQIAPNSSLTFEPPAQVSSPRPATTGGVGTPSVAGSICSSSAVKLLFA